MQIGTTRMCQVRSNIVFFSERREKTQENASEKCLVLKNSGRGEQVQQEREGQGDVGLEQQEFNVNNTPGSATGSRGVKNPGRQGQIRPGGKTRGDGKSVAG